MTKHKYTRSQTSLHPEIIDLLNDQVSKEAEASSLYLAMASWAEYNGYSRSAEFFYDHAVEERDHDENLPLPQRKWRTCFCS